MNFDQFHELIFRLAMTAYSAADKSITNANKVKALLLFIWKSVNTADASEKAVNGRGSRSVCDASKSVKSGDLNLFGSSQFNVTMTEVWAEDGYREYLIPVEEEGEDGETVLHRMLNIDGSQNFSGLDLDKGLSQAGSALSPSVVSSTVSTSALGKLLSERPSIVKTLLEDMKDSEF